MTHHMSSWTASLPAFAWGGDLYGNSDGHLPFCLQLSHTLIKLFQHGLALTSQLLTHLSGPLLPDTSQTAQWVPKTWGAHVTCRMSGALRTKYL
eukprot:5477596-Amphidinium_carterae.1